MKKSYLLENIFFNSTKKVKIDNDGKLSDGHISIKDYWLVKRYGLCLIKKYGWLSWSLFKKRHIKLDVVSINERCDIGYFLEVDVEYPNKLCYRPIVKTLLMNMT